MALTPTNFVAPICYSAVILFGLFAFSLYSRAKNNGELIYTTDFFLTARNTQPWYRVAWGFYACTIGAGVVFSVPSFVVDKEFGGGYIGLITYSLFSGLPFLIIAWVGTYIKKRFPDVISIGSYAKWRFGSVFQTWVTLNVLFNLGIALSVEYTAIGALSRDYLNLPPFVPILLVATVTMIYSAVGGLYVGLITDQFQSLFIILMLFVVGIWVSIQFRIPPLGPLPDYLGATQVGWASFATLGIALLSSAMFSDAVWQRVWSAKDEKSLYMGAAGGSLLAMTITFLFGFGAYIASWAGLVDNPNTAFFELLKVGEGDERAVPIGMLLLVMLIASIMNESAIDSFQIAISDTVISLFEVNGFNLGLSASRAILALMNIPFAIIGLFGLRVFSLYLITNLLTTCLMMPMVFGMIQSFDKWIGEFDVLFGSITGILSIIIYAINLQVTKTGVFTVETILEGLVTTFYREFDWPPFIIGLGSSSLATFTSSAFRNWRYIITWTNPPTPAHLELSPEYNEKRTDI
jgi:Na+/proline symporter